MPLLSLGCGSGIIGKNITGKAPTSPLDVLRHVPVGAVSTWLQAGGVGIDAAHVYSWSVGSGHIKEGIRATGLPREKLFVTSKTTCSNKVAKLVQKDVQDMGVGHLDLLLIHSPSMGCGIFANTCRTWKQYNQLMRAGTTHAIGVSNFGVSDLEGLKGKVRLV